MIFIVLLVSAIISALHALQMFLQTLCVIRYQMNYLECDANILYIRYIHTHAHCKITVVNTTKYISHKYTGIAVMIAIKATVTVCFLPPASSRKSMHSWRCWIEKPSFKIGGECKIT